VIAALLLIVFMLRWVIRAMRSLFRGAERQVGSASGSAA
jgi:hypothetical protein